MKSLISDLHKAFSLLEDKNSAVKMKDYLKGQFAFYGIKAADRKQITKEFLKIHPLNDIDQLKEFVKLAWDKIKESFSY
jgi:3-methyladenine DNA glycosylase AlkD